MNGKMRAGIMFRMAELPNRNRNTTARLPVQNAIGRPSASNMPSEPNSSSVSHAISISQTHGSGSPARQDDDVFDQLGDALQQQQRGADRHHQLHRPVLHAPFGERDLAGAAGIERIHGEAPARSRTCVKTKMKKNTEVMMSAMALPRVENFA